jgi:hypothetical protein
MNWTEGCPPDTVSEYFYTGIPTTDEYKIKPAKNRKECQGSKYPKERTGVSKEVSKGSKDRA